MDIYYSVIKTIFRILHLTIGQDCRVGGETIFPSGAKIIAGNHPNVTDGLFLPFVFDEHLHFFIQGYVFDIPILGWLYRKSEQIPVLPGQKNRSLEQAALLLQQEKVVVIFPEGRLNPDQQPLKARTGAVRLSLMTHTPIIPVGFYVSPQHLHHIYLGKYDHQTHGSWQFGGHCYLQTGKPWLPEEEINGVIDIDKLHELTERLMEKIRVQAYAARRLGEKESAMLLSGASDYGWD